MSGLRRERSARLRDDSSQRRKSMPMDKTEKERVESPSSGGPGLSNIRTRLSTGTLHMNGTQTFKDIKLVQGSDDSNDSQKMAPAKDSPAALGKKRAGSDLLQLPPKRRKIGKNDGSGEGNKNDYFCWVCHKEGVVICCELCPRVYHMKCLEMVTDVPKDWVCPECEKIMRAECIDSRSRAMAMISVDTLCFLLKFALERMKHSGCEPFMKPVDQSSVPHYSDYIFHPMDLGILERNIKKKMYGCTEAFLADSKWILHNCIIFNGLHNKLTSAAKTIIKICRHEMSEIEVCPDCYLNSCVKKNDEWFCEPCREPHPLVWAKLKGYPFWPAKALREKDGVVDVRFFGAHDRSWVPTSQVFMLSEDIPTPMRNKRQSGFDSAMEETNTHIDKLRDKFNNFAYAPFRTPYDKTKIYSPIKKKKGFLSPAKKKPPQSKFQKASHHFNVVKRKTIDPKSSVTKTASAVRLKYNSIITTRKTAVSTGRKSPVSVKTGDSFSTELPPFQDPALNVCGLAKLKDKTEEVENDQEQKENMEDDDVKTDELLTKSDDEVSSEGEEGRLNESLLEKDVSSDEDSVNLLDDRVLDSSDVGSESSSPPKPSALKRTVVECKTRLEGTGDMGEKSVKETQISLEKPSTSVEEQTGSSVCDKDSAKKNLEEPTMLTNQETGLIDESTTETIDTQTVKAAVEAKTVICDRILTTDQTKESEQSSSKSNEIKSEKYSGSSSVVEMSAEGWQMPPTEQQIPMTERKTLSEGRHTPTTGQQTLSEGRQTPTTGRETPSTESKTPSEGRQTPTDSADGEIVCVAKGGKVSECVKVTSDKTKGSVHTENTKGLKESSAEDKCLEKDSVSPRSKSTSEKTQNIDSDFEPSLVMEVETENESDQLVIDLSEEEKHSPVRIAPSKRKSPPKITSKSKLQSEVDSLSKKVNVSQIVNPGGESNQLKAIAPKPTYLSSPMIIPAQAVIKDNMLVLNTHTNYTFAKKPDSSKTVDTVSDEQKSPTGSSETMKVAMFRSKKSQSSEETSEKSSTSDVQLLNEEEEKSSAETSDHAKVVVARYKTKLLDAMKSTLDEMCSDLVKNIGPENINSNKHYQQELEKLRWIHLQEVAELKHNFKLTVMEMRSCWDAEKQRLFKDISKLCEKEKNKAIAETKKKQWCAQCGKEAIYYCCWNTSYCTYECQQSHWPEHMPSCMQTLTANQEQEKADQSKTNTNKSSSTSGSKDEASKKGPPPGSKPAEWSEKDEAIQAQRTFNLAPPTTTSPTNPSNTSPQQGTWRNRARDNLEQVLRRQEDSQPQQTVFIPPQLIPGQPPQTAGQPFLQGGQPMAIQYIQQQPPQGVHLPPSSLPNFTQPPQVRLQGYPVNPNAGQPTNLIQNMSGYPVLRQQQPPMSTPAPPTGSYLPRSQIFLAPNAQSPRGPTHMPGQMHFQIRP